MDADLNDKEGWVPKKTNQTTKQNKKKKQTNKKKNEDWVPKNWCLWIVVLEKTLESPLDCKEIKLVNPKDHPEYYVQQKQ